MKTIQKSARSNNVCYDIRGPILEEVKQVEEDDHEIIKLNISSPTPFGFDAPEEIQLNTIRNLSSSAGYSDFKGIFAARKAVMHYTQEQGTKNITLDNIYLGSGASELIFLTTSAFLDAGDELLLSAPDYPLWTAVTSLSDGTSVHYTCDEANGWIPDLNGIYAKITPNIKGIVAVNLNSPTGASYSDELLLGIVAITREHGLAIFADEVYDEVLFDDNRHTAIDSLSEGVLTITFNSLPKGCHSCGYHAGWTVASGDKCPAEDYTKGLNMLSSMRLCANAPGQWAIQTVLGGYQSIRDLVAPDGRIRRQHDLVYEPITATPGVTCVRPEAALYTFPHLDSAVYPIEDDQTFIRRLLGEERVLLVQGIGFNWHSPDYSRIIFLPHEDDFREMISQIARFLERYRQRYGTGIRAA